MIVRMGLSFIALSVAAGCAPRVPCCSIRIVDATPFSKVMAEETVVKGFTKAEIRRCFGDGVLNKNGVPIYIVHNTKKIDGRYCHVGFVARTKNDPSRLQMNPTSYDGMEEVSCELKALACLRPEAAKRIARQFKMAIDPSPIPKPATQSH